MNKNSKKDKIYKYDYPTINMKKRDRGWSICNKYISLISNPKGLKSSDYVSYLCSNHGVTTLL